ncbi:MAG: MarR family EPS-associated transcriptional regulator [Proteobacteria bacterium]|nr:MarR family EPS-associated transcriptional regulator [Pseudomonadota bacterium]
MNEAQFKTLKELSVEGTVSQRDLSRKVGLSLGSINYIMKELIQKGYVKTQRFKNSSKKAAYIYVLTPQGINARVKQTQYFLQKKMEEYERLKMEIDELKKDTDEVGQVKADRKAKTEGDISL